MLTHYFANTYPFHKTGNQRLVRATGSRFISGKVVLFQYIDGFIDLFHAQ